MAYRLDSLSTCLAAETCFRIRERRRPWVKAHDPRLGEIVPSQGEVAPSDGASCSALDDAARPAGASIVSSGRSRVVLKVGVPCYHVISLSLARVAGQELESDEICESLVRNVSA